MEEAFRVFGARLASDGRMVPVPVFEDVDLDAPPLERWAWVAQFSQHFRSARQLILGEVGVNADNPMPMWV